MSALRASKWQDIRVLMSPNEMKAFMESMGDFKIYRIGAVIRKGEECFTHEEFLQNYTLYIQSLQQGVAPNETLHRPYFSSVWTVDPQCLEAQVIDDDHQLMKVIYPAVQLQMHRMHYSDHDGEFRSKVFGPDAISWGIQFSYPQIFQDPVSKESMELKDATLYPNLAFFKKMQRWMRNATGPTPFYKDGKKTIVPVRLGKECYAWIQNHPHLAPKGLRVEAT